MRSPDVDNDAFPRILLLTGTMPGCGSVGEIYLRDLCRAYLPGQVAAFVLRVPGSGTADHALADMPMELHDWSPQSSFEPRGRLAGLGVAGAYAYRSAIDLPKLVSRAQGFGRRQRSQLVWAVLDRPVLFALAHRVADALGLPMVTTVWDPPEQLVANVGLDRFSRGHALDQFGLSLTKSLTCSVMTSYMGRLYRERFGVECFVLRHGTDPTDWHEPATALGNETELHLGFAGTLYARDEWTALMEALESVEWRVAGRNVRVSVLGSTEALIGPGDNRVRWLGFRQHTEAIQTLASADVSYLPYWFDSAHSLSVRACFPTKLSSYLASGRPIFYHGPHDSSPTEFLASHRAGLCCHSLEPGAIIRTLARFVEDPGLYRSMTLAGREALESELNRKVFVRQFDSLIRRAISSTQHLAEVSA